MFACLWKWNLATSLLVLSQLALAAPPKLETAVAEYRQLPQEQILNGEVEAANQATVSAQTSGVVEAILFDVDDYVEKGALIIRLRDTEQKARLSQAEANLKEARARQDEAQKAHTRIVKIYKQKLVARSKKDEAEAALKAAKARYESARAGLRQAKEQYGYTKIHAPYAGIVTARHVEVGETAQPGQALINGLSLDRLRVNVDVPQSLIGAVRKLGKARVLSAQSGAESHDVEKLTVFPIADSATNTFKVRLDLPAGTPDLFPGMYVKVAFVTGSYQQLVVPAVAVVQRSEVTAVYVMAADGQIMLRQIRLGDEVGNGMVAILAGLEEGEQVALNPVAAGIQIKQGN